MEFNKKELIKGYQRTIEQNEEKIVEYSKLCDAQRDESERLSAIC